MDDTRDLLERVGDRFDFPVDAFGRLERRRDRRHRDQRIRAAVLGIAVAIAVAWFGIHSMRFTSQPANHPTEDLGIFAPLAGRVLYENGDDGGYGRGYWAVDPSGPSDTTDGPRVADDVISTLVPLVLDGTALGWSSDGTELLVMRGDGDQLFPKQYLSILHADGSETRLIEDPGITGGIGISGAAISPDGTHVVVAGEYDLTGLYVVDAQGGRLVPLPIRDAWGSPAFSPDGTQIAYFAGNGEAQLWVANADGTDAHRILADAPIALRNVSDPAWSPAGDQLAISVDVAREGGQPAIYTFAPDGSDFTQVISDGISPYWSPDGTQIAFTKWDSLSGTPAGLSIADADGTNIREFGFAASGPWHPGSAPITESPPTLNEPTPAADDSFARVNGEVLDFTGVPNETPGDLVAVNPETGAERVLVADLDTVYSARWSADGRWVAYQAPGAGGVGLWVASASQDPHQVATDPSLWMWSSTGAELAVVQGASSTKPYTAGAMVRTIDPVTGEMNNAGSIPSDVGDTSAPVWSPDQRRFVFGARGGAIYAIDVRSGASSLLARMPGENLDSVDQIAWSPDGAHIAVMVDRGGVYVMDDDGSNIRRLAGYSDRGMAWSPDGTGLAYSDGVGPILIARTDGSAPTEIGSPAAPNPEACAILCFRFLTWSPDGSRIGSLTGAGTYEASAIDVDGRSGAKAIDEVTYTSWAGGAYDCKCE